MSTPSPSTPATQTQSALPAKKRRNHPGCPDPEAEVIALSPRTLMATNRFVCEVCGKGFQREQNLQLHRRGHNLPWKLKQKSAENVRRKVYLCPEPTCVHHEPTRALGDLTGIKKHYCRKHGEKKWTCDRCDKRYAVHSDWKAHSKTCGTKEYRCDCGTLFSRRDSFLTHRAFCDALTQEAARHPVSLTSPGGHMYGSNVNLEISQVNAYTPSSLYDVIHPPTTAADHLSPSNASFYLGQEYFGNADALPNPFAPDLQSNAGLFSTSSHDVLIQHQISGAAAASNEHAAVYSSFYSNSIQMNHQESVISLPPMSATALLQKAALVGSTVSLSGGGGFGCAVSSTSNIQDLLSSVANANAGGIGSFGSDGLTRDFLGVGGVVRGGRGSINIGAFEPESTAGPAGWFPGGTMQ